MTCPGAVNVSYVYEKNIFIMLEINVSDFYKYNYACEWHLLSIYYYKTG